MSPAFEQQRTRVDITLLVIEPKWHIRIGTDIHNPAMQVSVISVYGGEMAFQENGVAAKRVGLFEVQNGDKKFVRYIEAK